LFKPEKWFKHARQKALVDALGGKAEGRLIFSGQGSKS